MDWSWALSYVANLSCTTLYVTLCDSYSLDDDLIRFRQGAYNHAGLPFVLSCYYFYIVSFFYVHTKIVIRLQRQS